MKHDHSDDSATTVDPVCGMKVDPHTAEHQATHRGHTYHVCSAGCREKFVARPEEFAAVSAVDPVCGMKVDPHTAKHRATHQGHTYYFCSAGCREKFVARPEQYLAKREKAEE